MRRSLMDRLTDYLADRFVERLGDSIAAVASQIDILEVGPNDVLILRFPGSLRADQVERIKENWRSATKDTALEGRKLIVIDSGPRLSVHRAVTSR